MKTVQDRIKEVESLLKVVKARGADTTEIEKKIESSTFLMMKDNFEKADILSQEAFDEIKKIKGFERVFAVPFYNEFVIKCKDAKNINKVLLQEQIIGPLELGGYHPELKNHLLFCVTEMNSKEEIDKLISVLKKALIG